MTVLAASGDNLAAHHAIERVQGGEVICLAAPAGSGFGVWGEITTSSALERGAAGLVTSCGVRDIEAIQALGFPIFAAAHAIQGTVKRDPGRHGVPIRIGRALIRPGDWIVGDADGCVVIAREQLESVVVAAESKLEAEDSVLAAIAAGSTSRRALALP